MTPKFIQEWITRAGPVGRLPSDHPVLFSVMLVLLAAVTLFVLYHLFKIVPVVVKSAVSMILNGLKMKKADKSKTQIKDELKNAWLSVYDSIAVLMDTLRYLCTRKQWRYRVPWYLMLGDEESGKTDMLNALKTGRRQQILLKEKHLIGHHTDWFFYDRGIVIKVPGQFGGSGAVTETEQQWFRILEMLGKNRPERPLDGIILVISAGDFLSAQGNKKRLQLLADTYYRRLWQIQKELGFTLPVYIIVSKCERLKGFESFWSVQNPERRGEMFGWSNPFALDTAFSETWLDSVFEEMGTVLQKIQIEAAAVSTRLQDPDGFFLFPQYFSALKNPLQEFLARLFTESAFHLSFYFRGLYFSGNLPVDDAEANDAQPKSEVCFIEQLFDQKIMAEPHLAQPTRKAVFSRDRLIRKIQIAMLFLILLFSVGLLLDKERLDRQIKNSIDTLTIIGSQEDDCSEQGEKFYSLLETVAGMKLHSTYWTIPASWTGNIQEITSSYIADQAFEESIFPGMACRFEKKADALHGLKKSARPPEETLFSYLEEVRSFEEHLRNFMFLSQPDITSVHGDEPIKILNQLAVYLYGKPLSQALYRPHGQHRRALQKVGYRIPWASRNGEYRDQDLLPPLLDAGIVYQNIGLLSEQIRKNMSDSIIIPENSMPISAFSGGDESGVKTAERTPIEVVKTIHLWFHYSLDNWVAKSEMDNPCARVHKTLTDFQKNLELYGYANDFLSPIIEQYTSSECYEPICTLLLNQNVAPFGPLFTRNAKGQIEIAESVSREGAGFAGLMNQGFMQLQPGEQSPQAGTPVAWDIGKLEEALGYYWEFETFIKKMNLSTPSVKNQPFPVYARIALFQLQRIMDATILQAQIFDTTRVRAGQLLRPVSAKEAALGAGIENFSQARNLLLQLLSVYAQLGFEESRTALAAVSRRYALNALEQIDDLIREERLYEPDPKPQWESPTLAGALYHLNETDQVKDYLTVQKQRILYLASRYADPLIVFLLNTEDTAPVETSEAMLRWRQTLVEIDRFQRKDPSGGLQQLEDYFLKQLSQTGVQDFDKKAAAPKGRFPGDDLFTTVRRSIEMRVYNYCRFRDQSDLEALYADLAQQFNLYLAGRFPFGGRIGSIKNEASYKLAGDFFNEYYLPRVEVLQRFSDQEKNPKKYARVANFLAQLDSVNRFLAPSLFEPQAPGQPILIHARFRAYPERSPGSDQIVQWRFGHDDQFIEYPGIKTDLEWSFGQPVFLTLRWASGSPYRPQADPKKPQLTVRDSTATFRSTGNWALLHFLFQNKAKDAAVLNAANPNQAIMTFDMPVQLTDARQKQNTGGSCRVYLSLDLYGIDPKTKQKIPLHLPDVFPEFAPMISAGN